LANHPPTKPKVALLVAKNSRRWWHNSRLALNNVLTIAYFDRLGIRSDTLAAPIRIRRFCLSRTSYFLGATSNFVMCITFFVRYHG
jgi:hypothetical protein